MTFRACDRWTWANQAYLISHAQDGVAILAEVFNVSEDEIIKRAEISGLRLTYSPDYGELLLCPECCERFVRPQTNAGRVGLCPSCWERRKAEAMREKADYLEAHRDYERAKKQAQRRRNA